jgi:coniferyl-aldehyde dehydrogenase
VYLPNTAITEFVALAQSIVTQRYPSIDSPDLTAIIDDTAFARITRAMDEAQAQGATLVQLIPGKKWDAQTRKIAPHLVLNLPPDTALHNREIFGPVLPVFGYASLEEPIRVINSGTRPLAFYPFSHNKKVVAELLDRVMSGGVSVNDALFHVAQHDLPFGGVGESGMGHYHGYEGFVTFSKMRPIFKQASFSAVKFLWPPYGKFASKYLDFLSR